MARADERVQLVHSMWIQWAVYGNHPSASAFLGAGIIVAAGLYSTVRLLYRVGACCGLLVMIHRCMARPTTIHMKTRARMMHLQRCRCCVLPRINQKGDRK